MSEMNDLASLARAARPHIRGSIRPPQPKIYDNRGEHGQKNPFGAGNEKEMVWKWLRNLVAGARFGEILHGSFSSVFSTPVCIALR